MEGAVFSVVLNLLPTRVSAHFVKKKLAKMLAQIFSLSIPEGLASALDAAYNVFTT